MVPIRIRCESITAETFSPCIIIVINCLARPAGFAFNSEMIIGCDYQIAGTGAGFVYALCENDGCRNAGALHFSNSQKFICVDICIYLLRSLRGQKTRKQERNKQYLKF